VNFPDSYQPAPDLLRDRVILITGAGSGLGRAAAHAFARYGATVAMLSRSEERLDVVYDELVAAGAPEPAMFPFDLSKADDRGLENLAGAIEVHLKRLDGILHSAHAFYNLSPLSTQTLETWEMLLRVNLMAPFALTRACLPLLSQSPDASVIFTGETHGHQPAAYWGSYAVAKSGLETLSTIWGDELATVQPNLRINTLVPGPTATTLRTRTHPAEDLNRLPLPEQLMPDYLYLMGPDSHGITGQTLLCPTRTRP